MWGPKCEKVRKPWILLPLMTIGHITVILGYCAVLIVIQAERRRKEREKREEKEKKKRFMYLFSLSEFVNYCVFKKVHLL